MDGFLLTYHGFEPGFEGLREALTSTGNGYLCTRGAAEWEEADGVHYPGTYVHGGYNRETTILSSVPVLNEDLVNMPNWLVLQLRIEGGEAIRLADVDLLGYRHELDIRYATVVRHVRFRDLSGRETTLHSRRFVSMGDAHHAGIEWTLVPENWSGRVEVVTAIDGRVSNGGVARYRQLEGRHLNPVSPRTFGLEVIALKPRPGSRICASAMRPAHAFSPLINASGSSGGCIRWRTISSRSSPSRCNRERRCGSRR